MAVVVESFARGENYEILVEERIAFIRVWQRPDLSFEAGAALALEIKQHVARLAAAAPWQVAGIVLDQRKAPPLAGKRTRAAIGEMIASCVEKQKRFALLNAPGVQNALMRPLIASTQSLVRAFIDIDAAREWIWGVQPA